VVQARDANGNCRTRCAFLGDAKSSLGDAKSSPGDAESSLGDAESSLGDVKSSPGDAESSLGHAKNSLGDAKRSLGDAKSSLGDAKRFLWVAFTAAATRLSWSSRAAAVLNSRRTCTWRTSTTAPTRCDTTMVP
jgi:hypothetical protein